MSLNQSRQSTPDLREAALYRADSPAPAIPDDAAMSVVDAAEFLNVRPASLNKWRVTGEGPKFARLGRRIVYRPQDLREWLAERVRASTSA